MKKSKHIANLELFRILNGKISTIISRSLFDKFRKANLGITVEQWTVLACLWEKDKVTQQSLCDITLRDKPSMTRLIDNLEKRNWVIRVPDAHDRRVNLIHLTEKGKALEQQASTIVAEVIDRMLMQISTEEAITCRNVINTIYNNLK